MKNELQKGVLLFTFIFALLSINYYHDFAPRLPYGVHDEAQADRLAVAIQFHDRGMDFFHPRTYHIYATDGITGIEFPIHSYVAAALGFIFGRDNIPICFRLLTLLIAYFGLLSLYLTAYRRTNDIVSSLFPPLFLFSSPVFVYYACNFMPDAAATSISFIGFYYFMRFYEHKKFKQLITAFVFFTLAALMKTTVAIVLLTVMGYLLLDMLFFKKLIERKLIGKTFLVFAVSLSCILIYYFYNQYLLDKYNGYSDFVRRLFCIYQAVSKTLVD